MERIFVVSSKALVAFEYPADSAPSGISNTTSVPAIAASFSARPRNVMSESSGPETLYASPLTPWKNRCSRASAASAE